MERRLTTILAADVVGYSRLMGKDEDGTLQRYPAELFGDLPVKGSGVKPISLVRKMDG